MKHSWMFGMYVNAMSKKKKIDPAYNDDYCELKALLHESAFILVKIYCWVFGMHVKYICLL